MRRSKRCVEAEREVIALFTAQEVMTAMYKSYPERFTRAPDQANLWFSFVPGGMAVEVEP